MERRVPAMNPGAYAASPMMDEGTGRMRPALNSLAPASAVPEPAALPAAPPQAMPAPPPSYAMPAAPPPSYMPPSGGYAPPPSYEAPSMPPPMPAYEPVAPEARQYINSPQESAPLERVEAAPVQPPSRASGMAEREGDPYYAPPAPPQGASGQEGAFWSDFFNYSDATSDKGYPHLSSVPSRPETRPVDEYHRDMQSLEYQRRDQQRDAGIAPEAPAARAEENRETYAPEDPAPWAAAQGGPSSLEEQRPLHAYPDAPEEDRVVLRPPESMRKPMPLLPRSRYENRREDDRYFGF